METQSSYKKYITNTKYFQINTICGVCNMKELSRFKLEDLKSEVELMKKQMYQEKYGKTRDKKII